VRRFVPLAWKVNLILVSSLAVGIGAAILYLAWSQNRELREVNAYNLQRQSEILYQSIKNAMLPGEAPVAVQLFADVRLSTQTFDVSLYRADGVEAFSDNKTIETVNAVIGKPYFKPKAQLMADRRVLARDPNFSRAVQERRTVLFQRREGERSYALIYKTLLNLPKCAGCHGSTHTVRGVIHIRSDITGEAIQQRSNILLAAAIFAVLVPVLAVLLARYLQSALVRPVRHLGEVCAGVRKGDFSLRARVASRDEIGRLGETVNEMVDGLYERFQLSKFVSGSTLQSIRNRERGARAAMTLLFSDVRGFTSYAERLPPERVVESLNRLFDAQTQIIHRNGGDVDKFVGDAVVAVFSGERREENACRSALEIQAELTRDPRAYDGLRVGVGLDSGEVILGLVGSEKRADFTVIGDHVNTAARLCAAARPGMVLVTESVFAPLHGTARGRGPAPLKVKGKAEPLRVYQILSMRGKQA
jgi:class 3 adenylate cyclase